MTRPSTARAPSPRPAQADAAGEPVPAGLAWVSDAEPGYRLKAIFTELAVAI